MNSCLDNVATDLHPDLFEVAVEPVMLGDHDAVCFNIKSNFLNLGVDNACNSLKAVHCSQDLLNQISEAERIRLLELIQVLNKRIDAQRNSLNQQEEELRNERQKSAKLETKVARLELLRVNNNSADKMYSSKLSIDDNNGNSHINEKSQERIELLEEQCATLKTRLRCLSQEKVEDVQSLTNLLEEAKLKFMEALKSRSSREVQFAIPSF
ncbi:uncharacterized protein LOC120351022 [Nilaparvata lugens]|uniref:uncharacterized protein LOC120351022 n=1 Tax=Nilaparvata lugens TaxID=108931 RepID=UPI00193DA835|nr:uncharacterized protein LOC120351022 [Nilaparvata lugens]